MTAKSGNASVEHVEDKSTQNPKEAGFVGLGPGDVSFGLEEAALDNLKNGHKSAEKISSGHEAGKKISHPFSGGIWRAWFYAGHRARIVWPPTTRWPTWTWGVQEAGK